MCNPIVTQFNWFQKPKTHRLNLIPKHDFFIFIRRLFENLNYLNKNLLRLVGNNREKLEATLSSEQSELFEKYYTATNEMNSVSETAAFKLGFSLAVELLTE